MTCMLIYKKCMLITFWISFFFINNVSVCVPKSVDFILSMFFELISFEFNTLEIILKRQIQMGYMDCHRKHLLLML